MDAHMLGDPVEQRHRQRPPFDDRLVAPAKVFSSSARCLGRSAPASTSRPPLRYSGRPVSCIELDDFEARALDRLDQRVGKPLRELVERHPGRSPDAATHRPSATARSATACRARRRGSTRPSPCRPVLSPRGRTARPGRSSPTPPSLRSRSARPSSPTSGLCAFTWKPMAMSIGVSADSRSASTRSGSPLAIAAERAVGEHVEARYAQAFGACVGLAGAGLAVGPGRARARVEQHRHDGEIHATPRDLFLRQCREASAQARPSGRDRRPRNAASANGRESPPDWRSACA